MRRKNEDKDERKMSDSVVIKRLFVYAKPYLAKLIIVLLSVLISSFMMSYVSKLFGNILDLLSEDGTVFSDVVSIAAITISFIIGSCFISYIRGLALNRIGQRILYDIRNEIFSHVEGLSLSEIDKTPTGTFVTRITNDTNSLSELFTNVVVSLVSQTSTLIYAVILMFVASWKLSLIVMCVMPFLIASTILFKNLSRSAFRSVTKDNSRLNSFLSENLSGMKITQIFNREDAKLNEFDELSKSLTKSHIKTTVVFGIFRPFIYVVFTFGNCLIFYFGSKMVQDPNILFTSGMLYSFYLYNLNVFDPIQNIAQQYNTMQSAFASAEKIFTIMDMKSSIVLSDSPKKADDFKGEIEFKDVWFKYKEDWIIKGMSFHVYPGQVVSFVGPTGAGKTTILSLIGRYYDCQKGEILIDGINVKDYDIHSLRQNIGEMLQDVFLFTGTIKDNITLREDAIPDEEIIKASKYVNADSFISKLEHGYDEQVRERGNNYSQGQRQLLSFARTIVAKPKMIILDEATSNIDTETEILIQDSLEKIKTIGTTLMVAHRLSTIQHSDCIMFIDDGKIIEQGNHQELLKLKGRYYNLYKLQYE